jgi:iron complex outermembrane receptor protein
MTMQEAPGTLSGVVMDRATDSPLPGATVQLSPTSRGQATDEEGQFTFRNVAPGAYEIEVRFVGYAPHRQPVTIESEEPTRLTIELRPQRVGLPDVVVTGALRERTTAEVYRPISALSGEELQQQLGSSIPETLQRVPGFAMQYNGPGATRPSIRGMGGDRVLMLEDGQRTGDLYQTTADHGVMMEPLTAEQIEVIRGPAGLLYGSQALGGVVNVIRNDTPRTRPNEITGMVTTQATSVNDGLAGGATVEAPVGPLALRGELSLRDAQDTRTPQGDLPSTDQTVLNGSLGASWLPAWGVVGASYRYYDTAYGVPGTFNGTLIPGAHPGGVDIEATRETGRLRIVYDRPLLGVFDRVEWDANLIRYDHTEIERRRTDAPDIIGTRFEQTSGEVNLTARHTHAPHGLRLEGAMGLSWYGRDLESGGVSPGTRSGRSGTVAAFAYEEIGYRAVRLQLGARFDYTETSTVDRSDIRVRTREGNRITKPVQNRTFGNASGSLAALYTVSDAWTVGTSVSRSFRSPAIEEMYSDGPHLADFSFDIGTPNLKSEIGHGLDLFVRGNTPRLEVEAAAYVNRVNDYIFYAPTGLTVFVDREGDLGRITPVFEAENADATFVGGEGRVQYELLPPIIADVTASYVRATRRADDNPLPFIPPLTTDAELRYDGSRFFGHLGMTWTADQTRVPDPVQRGGTTERPQPPTDGYVLWRGGVGAAFATHGTQHRITLQSQNLTDSTWRDHTSRIKDVAPQPGRNISLTYRVRF